MSITLVPNFTPSTLSLPADTPTTTITAPTAVAASQDSDEIQPSSLPSLDSPTPPKEDVENKPQIPPTDSTICPESKAAAIITLNPNGTVRPSPKVVINGIAPHVFDERKSRPRSPARPGSGSTRGGRSSSRNLRRLQYIQQQQQRQRQLEQQCQSRCRSQQSTWWSQQRCQYPMCPKFDSSPLRVCTFEDLQAQVEFVVETTVRAPNPCEGMDEKCSSCPVEIPLKSELKLKRDGGDGVQQTTKPRSRRWKVLKIHVDVHLFKSLALKLKHGI